MSKTIDLAKKLMALAKQGVGGEKDNAARMLQDFMKKHNITEEMIEGEEVFLLEIKCTIEQEPFLIQVTASCVDREKLNERKYGRHKKGFLSIQLTMSEFAEVKSKFDFYWKALKEEEKILYSAFIQKNHLYRVPSDKQSDEKELTPEEEAELKRVFEMMKGIKQSNFHKQIS